MPIINYKSHFEKILNKFRDDGFKRTFTPIIRDVVSFPFSKLDHGTDDKILSKKSESLQIWCTNDYLNMSHNSEVIEEMISVIRKVGTGSGGTRNISGTSPTIKTLKN